MFVHKNSTYLAYLGPQEDSGNECVTNNDKNKVKKPKHILLDSDSW